MPRSFSAVLSSPKLSTLILSFLICSTLSFAATPDRIAGDIVSSRTVALAKSHHPKADPQYDLGPVDPSRQLSYITLLMKPSPGQQQALDRLLALQQDPKSALYHQWLTPQQYADRFGLSQNDISKITAWLGSQGFQVLSIAGGRNSVIFSGTAAQVQGAFGTEIHSYKVNGEEHFANSTPVMLPSALNGIVTTVMGLHDFRPKPARGGRRFAGLRNGRPDYYDANFFFPNFLAPGDLATIYDISPLYNASTPIDGTGQKLAIVGQTDIYLADINFYRSDFGLSTIPTSGAGSCTTDANGIIMSPCTTSIFDYVLVGNTDPGVPFAGDLGESDLDIEQSGAVARNAQIVFVTAAGPSVDVLDALMAAINPPSGPPLAPVVSMSYGLCEAESPDLETLLQQGNAEGVTVVNSSGDAGSTTCDSSPNSSRPFAGAGLGLSVSYPASSPEVTGVGGTAISLANDSFPNPSAFWSTTIGANGGTAVSYIPELAWNDDEGLAQFCQAEPTLTFCKQGSTPPVTGWVPLTATATAAQVQNDIWISQAGGGASNCFTETPQGVCQAGFPQPTWQQGLSVPSAPPGVRYVPDVALLASPDFPGYIWCTPQSELNEGGSTSTCAVSIFDAVDTFGSIIGGTSASAPVFAGVLTLVNQYLVQNGFQANPGLGNANPDLYHIATYNQTAFHQLKTGDNMVYCQPHTPSNQPTALQCPAAVAPATEGVFGFQASNADPVTGYNLVNGLGSIDANSLATAWGELLTASTTTLSPSAAQIVPGGSETFTITVTPSSASGVVSLSYSNNGGAAVALGTANVSGGTGSFTTTALPVGTNSITGTYMGTNASSTSAAVMVVVVAPTFKFKDVVSPGAVLSGESTTSTFTVAPTGTGVTTFAANVALTISGCPANTTCSLSTNPILAGSGATTETLTITTTGPNQAGAINGQRRADKRLPWLPLALPLAGIVMVGFAGRRISKRSAIAGLCVSLALLGLLVACGGGSSSPPPVAVSVGAGSPSSVFPNNTGWTPVQTAQFTATVTNTTNTAVTWSFGGSGCTGTPNPCGSFSSTTSNPTTYMAPQVPAQGGAALPTSVTITATSAADTTKSGSATETIKPATIPGMYTVTVTATESTTVNTLMVPLTVQ